MKPQPCRDWNDAFPSTTVNLVVDAARAMRLNLAPLVKDTPLSHLQFRQRGPANLNVSRSQFTPLYMHCMLALYREYVGAPCTDDRDLFLACIINGKTLEEVITRGIAFTKYCSTRGVRQSLDSTGSEVILTLDTNLRGDSHEAMIDLFSTAGLYKLFSWLIGESLCASRVTIAQKKLDVSAVMNDFFDCPVHFQGSINTIAFPREMLKKPMVRTYRELVDLVAMSPLELMPLSQPSSLSAQLEILFRKWLIEGVHIPSINELAAHLCQSGSTLRRNLAREDSSFQCLVDKCRKERAIELLGGTSLTIDEISYCLGYSAPSGFTRAFKDWTGHTPSAYRCYLLTQERMNAPSHPAKTIGN